jgi:hypothetical protein
MEVTKSKDGKYVELTHYAYLIEDDRELGNIMQDCIKELNKHLPKDHSNNIETSIGGFMTYNIKLRTLIN